MSPEKNSRNHNPKRTEIEHLLFMYKGEIGAGKMDRAALTLGKAVGLLMEAVYPLNTAEDEQLDLFRSAVNNAVCAPCDVTKPNNMELIEDFKFDLSNNAVTRNGITEPIIEHQPLGVPLTEPDPEILKKLAEEARTVIPPAEPIAPAPKTQKKQKPKTGDPG
jgi:hypothetical protein